MRGREFWVSKVAEYERSELTQESFAQQRGIAVSTLRWWIAPLIAVLGDTHTSSATPRVSGAHARRYRFGVSATSTTAAA